MKKLSSSPRTDAEGARALGGSEFPQIETLHDRRAADD